MISQVDLNSPIPVVIATFGESGVNFAIFLASRFWKEDVAASIDRRALPLGERFRSLQESGGRVFFCGVGDEEVRLQMVRVKIYDALTEHLDPGSAVGFVKAELDRGPAREAPAAPPPPAAPSDPAKEVVSRIIRKEDGTLALRSAFDPKTAGELMDFFCGMAALTRR